MTVLVIGIVLVLGTSIVVKLFDSEIRKNQWSKALVNIAMILGLLMTIGGFILILQ